MKKLNIVFFGTPDFSVPSLEILANHPHINIKYVISMPDRKAGRGMELKSPEVIEYAKQNKIPFFQTENINKEEDFIKTIEGEKIDAFIVLAFAQFLGSKVLNLPSLGCFNIHTSLLPKYRGAAPIQYALLNGDSSTGVSIQRMVKKMDAGDLAWSHAVKINEGETGGQLYTRLKFQAALALNDFLFALKDGSITYEKQDESQVSFAPTLKREDGFLDFKNQNFKTISNKVCALYPWPGTYCFLDKKRMKVFNISKSSSKLAPGEINIKNSHLLVGCLDQTVRLNYIQLEGKKACSDIELLNGLKKDIVINP
ncbi:MAG: methionyl-tRNA formyltransferase [Bacteriovoracaceae bacterium]|jgi:methionyl-tRNA formyltransferase